MDREARQHALFALADRSLAAVEMMIATLRNPDASVRTARADVLEDLLPSVRSELARLQACASEEVSHGDR
jgi:hypothetical protein